MYQGFRGKEVEEREEGVEEAELLVSEEGVDGDRPSDHRARLRWSSFL